MAPTIASASTPGGAITDGMIGRTLRFNHNRQANRRKALAKRTSGGWPMSAKCRNQTRVRGAAYLARFQTTSVVPPVDATGLVSFSSSAETANLRFWSVPFQFGNELPT